MTAYTRSTQRVSSTAARSIAGGNVELAASGSLRQQNVTSSARGQGWLSRHRVSKKDIVQFSSQLALMTRSGVDLVSALDSLRRQCTRPQLKSILADVHKHVLDGKAFSDALTESSDIFDGTFVASIAAGEASGRLPEVLSRLSGFERKSLRLRNAIRTMLTYPLLLVIISGAVVLALILFVLPTFSSIFDDYEMPLPLLTQLLVDVSSNLRQRWWLWGPAAAALILAGIVFRRSETGRQFVDHAVLHWPLIGTVTQALLIGRTCQLLGLMLQSGVPLLEALRLTRGAAQNSLYRQLFVDMETEVTNGRGMAATIGSRDFVPGYAAEMIITAERTGKLGNVVELVGEHFEEEGESALRGLVAFMEPAITVVMGAVVAVIVLSIMLPMFELTSLAEKGAG